MGGRRRFLVGRIVDGAGVPHRRVLLRPCRGEEVEVVVGPKDQLDYPVAKLFMTFSKPWIIFTDEAGEKMLGEIEFPKSTVVIREFLGVRINIGGGGHG